MTCTYATDNMYMMKARKKTRWTIASARQRLPALIGAAAHEPQAVYRRTKLVAAVVGPDAAAKLQAGLAAEGPRIADAVAELRRICTEEKYALPAIRRGDRRNAAASGGTGRRR